MNDREMLELAALAAGYGEVWSLDDHPDVTYIGPRCSVGKPVQYRVWNPLEDDGDALRLFCAFPWMCIETSDLAATVRERGNPDEPTRVCSMWTEWLDKHNGDLNAATRRAIVRAAAEIGKDMK